VYVYRGAEPSSFLVVTGTATDAHGVDAHSLGSNSRQKRCFVHGHSWREANSTEGNSRVSMESELLCSHSHGESIATHSHTDRIAVRNGYPSPSPSLTVTP